MVGRMGEAISQLTNRVSAPRAGSLRRFDLTERVLHWVTALDVLTLIVTGAILYFPSFSVRVGRRFLIENIHTLSGFLALVPLLIALSGRWGATLRKDVTRLTRFDQREWRWFDRTRRMKLVLGKFNPGQKLNAILSIAGLVVLLCTGIVLRFPNPFSLSIRQGATFVHDWFAFAIGLLVLGHIGFVLFHPRTLWSMLSGRIDRLWAERHAPGWVQELDLEDESRAERSLH